MKKSLIIVVSTVLFLLAIFASCTKKQIPGGPLDATYTPTYTPTPSVTPNIRYDVIVLKVGGAADSGQTVSIKYEAQATWTPIVVNPASGIASFTNLNILGNYDVKVTSLSSCYDEYNYQIDLQGSTVTVINRNGTPTLQIINDSGFDTFSVYPQVITYTVQLKTDYPYLLNNFTVEGLPASCAVNWDLSTSNMHNNNDFIKLYITTPPSYLINITFTVKADRANCVGGTKIISPVKTINRAWSINATAEMIYYKYIDQFSFACINNLENYGAGYTNVIATPIGLLDTINWEIANFDLETCGGWTVNNSSGYTNCNASMYCMGTYTVNNYMIWNGNGTHADCYCVPTVRLHFFNSKGLNYYLYFRGITYPKTCNIQSCDSSNNADGKYLLYNDTIIVGTEQ